jgi:hypothetical protein
MFRVLQFLFMQASSLDYLFQSRSGCIPRVEFFPASEGAIFLPLGRLPRKPELLGEAAKQMSGNPTYRPLEHKIRSCGATAMTSELLKVVSAAAMATNKRRRF